ncbi:MAG: PAS domain S-box protein [Candidatus Neomarinimicrobiota bacterium]
MSSGEKTEERLVEELQELRDRVKELEHVKRELLHTREYTRSIIDSSMDMIIAVDNDRRITEFNGAAEETLGYRREEVLGKHINILYEDVAEGRSVYESTIKDQQHIHEILNKRKNGETFPCLLAASVLFDSHGAKVGQMGISRDITDVKKAEQERERLISDLKLALESVKTLTGLIPICARCKKIRDDEGFWQQVESYIGEHSDAEFSHGMCPECLKETYPELYGKGDPDLSN